MSSRQVERCRFRPPPSGILLMWEVIDYCNLRCAHCCTNSGPHLSRQPAVSTEAARRLLEEAAQIGIKDIAISGGEPLLRGDLLDILAARPAPGVGLYLNTNGYRLDVPMARRLAEIGVQRVSISLDGYLASEHNAIRGNRSSFARAVRGIKACIAADVPVRVSGVLTPTLALSVEKYVEFLAALGVRAIVLNTVFPVGRSTENPRLFLAEDLNGLSERLNRLREKCSEEGIDLDYSLPGSTSSAPDSCGAGAHILYIAANGDVSGCSWLYKLSPSRFTFGNIARDRITNIMRRVPEFNSLLPGMKAGCPLPHVAAESA